jgi:pyridoxamine 5'-phosphate oxidase
MNLSTVSSQGKPSSRILLLKGFDERGFVFYSNYESRKALELQNNPCAAITFLWLELYKQVRIEGVVIKIPTTESDIYFQSRPRGSQLGAWVSDQSNSNKE